MKRYALQGTRDWVESEKSGRKVYVEKLLGARIADTEYLAATAVRAHNVAQSKEVGDFADLLPVPDISVKNIEWAFFKPRRVAAGAELMFDLVFWLPGGRHICFRLEPAHQHENGRHGYSHVQISSRIDGKQLVPEKPLDWLPTSCPAFPVPGTCSLDRFLMLVVALHGFPARTSMVLAEIWTGRLREGQEYVNRVRRLLNPTQEPSAGI